MSNDYQPGDEIEWRSAGDGEWYPAGRYVGTTSTGHVVYEDEDGDPEWLDSDTACRRVPDMITVTVEISREAAAEVAEYRRNPAAKGNARTEGFQAFIDAVREAVES